MAFMLLAGLALAQAVPDAAAAAAHNARMAARNATIASNDAARQAAWEAERDQVTAANAAAQADYAKAQAAYAAQVAQWRADTARVAQASAAPSAVPAKAAGTRPPSVAPGGERRICRTESVTGSLVGKRKVCTTAAERAEAARAAQEMLHGRSGSLCAGPTCN